MGHQALLRNTVYSLRAEAGILEAAEARELKEALEWEKTSDFIWMLKDPLHEWFDQLSGAQLERDWHLQLADTARRKARALKRKADKLERKADRIARRSARARKQ